MPEVTDELGAVVPAPPEHIARAMATEARGMLQNETYAFACRKLTDEYLRRFLNLKPSDPSYAEQCVRIQVACNVVADITTQLAILADFGKIDPGNVDRTARGATK